MSPSQEMASKKFGTFGDMKEEDPIAYAEFLTDAITKVMEAEVTDLKDHSVVGPVLEDLFKENISGCVFFCTAGGPHRVFFSRFSLILIRACVL